LSVRLRAEYETLIGYSLSIAIPLSSFIVIGAPLLSLSALISISKEQSVREVFQLTASISSHRLHCQPLTMSTEPVTDLKFSFSTTAKSCHTLILFGADGVDKETLAKKVRMQKLHHDSN
jgi:hypothetical protein